MTASIGPVEREPPKLSDFDNIPLFMKSLPEKDDGTNDALEALRSLVYEDSAEATALRLKDEANQHFRGKQFRQALSFYSQAINELSKDLSVDLLRTLYCNRAACQLELGNNGSCIRDCAQVLAKLPAENGSKSAEYDQTSKKALFRSTKALLRLEKYSEALDALDRMAAYKGGLDPAGLSLLEQVQNRLQAKKQDLQETAQRTKEKTALEASIKDSLKLRYVWIPEAWSYKEACTLATPPFQPPHFESDAQSDMLYPVFLLRPLHSPPTRDLIPQWNERVSIGEQIDAFSQQDPTMLISYNYYTITRKGRILKLGRHLDLASILKQSYKAQTQDGLELIGGWAFEVYALPSEEASEWISSMKRDLKAKGIFAS